MFLFITTTTNSLNRIALLVLLIICCIVPTLTDAYPVSTQLKFQRTNQENFLQRNQRGTGYYLVRHGDYVVLVPDPKHHFTKNIRLYIGR